VEATHIARRIIAECTAVARAKNIHLDERDVEMTLLQISRLSSGQEISTLQDIRHHRQTEIDTLNAEIVRIAETLGLSSHVVETRLLGELTSIKAAASQKINGGHFIS
jgi:2-dehydropantoate 2-reductase